MHIFGPSGAGVTTLGKRLATKDRPYFDVDEYYWKKTATPFTEKNPIPTRQKKIRADIDAYEHWILGGSLISWGDFIKKEFDLVVYLYVPQQIRIQRLKNREIERYGDKVLKEAFWMEKLNAFLAWAQRYEDDQFSGRSRKNQLLWLETLTCRVLKIEGDTTVAERIERIAEFAAQIDGK